MSSRGVFLSGIGTCVFLSLLLWSVSARAQGRPASVHIDSPTNLLGNPGFESLKPANWEPSGAGAEWTNATSRTPDWSLKLSGSGEARWEQKEAVRSWTPGFPQAGNPRLEVGAWVKMLAVNTDPVSDAEKFQLVFDFFEDATQTSTVLGGPVVVDLPQNQISTSGWIEIVSDPISFPGEKACKSARVTFRKGGRTAGAAFMDDLFIRSVDPAVVGGAGDLFNPNMDSGDKWGYWWSDFSSGSAVWPANQAHFVTVSDEDAHSGNYSLRMEANGLNSSEAIGVSEPIPVNGGEALLVSFWVKHLRNANEESIGAALNNLGVSALWFDGLERGAAETGTIGGIDVVLDGDVDDRLIPLLGQAGDWMHFAFVLYPKQGAVGMEIRPRYWHQFTGVAYWDDFFVAPARDVIETLSRLPPQVQSEY